MSRVTPMLRGIFELGDTSSRIPAMEGARGLAVLLVFLVHFRSLFRDYTTAGSLTSNFIEFAGTVGNAGVDLFFVLSGFLIYGAVIKRPVKFASFLKRRIQRIYPPFIAVLGLYLILSYLFPQKNKIPGDLVAGFIYIAWNVLLLPGVFDIVPLITVAWSLSYEWAYYLLIPLLVSATGMRAWTSRSRVICFIAAPALGLIASLTVSSYYVRFLMFSVGILLYEAMQSKAVLGRLTPVTEAVAIGLFGITFPLIFVVQHHLALLWFLPDAASLKPVYSVVIMGVGFFSFSLLAFGRVGGGLSRTFSWTPLRWLGNISYSYYLVHGLTMLCCQMLINKMIPPGGDQGWLLWFLLAPTFFLTLLTAAALFVTVEKPFALCLAVTQPQKEPRSFQVPLSVLLVPSSQKTAHTR